MTTSHATERVPKSLRQPRGWEEEARYWLLHRNNKQYQEIIKGLWTVEQVKMFVAVENRHQQRRDVYKRCSKRANEIRQANP